ncbi:hypothetical protein [Mucispirillum schaedleri]|jgi:ABC-type lipoprotein export system ATPase subunit|uniref:Uncharacterized protein n=1 Tax=Mucispirillum schaedleri ASF457 TaxID=1379858 RepID=V2RGW1_9BACT|nr:hypothetical protein [Mucispirillum schaedleri]MCX4361014.1 hypothetical protein [Mucispirillum schaedleri]USF25078.1 hypothetical protein N508_002173 [Mucispirillum schaedleri ASF457]SIW08209.1 conserved hypothetical protein [Mucispirillum schaedleri ASF457]
MINKNLVTLKANYLADTMQSELIKKTIWSNVSIVSYNIPLLAMLSIYENISLPLQYFENVKQKDAENIVLNMLKKYNMAHAMYYKPKKLNEFELLIVKYLRASIRKPKHIFFFLPHRMLLTDDYSPFIHFIKDINSADVTVVENYRYFDEYKNLEFKEIPYNSWQTLVLKI